MALRPCLELLADGSQCRQPCPGPRCEEHARSHDASRRAVYDDPRWIRLRRRVIARWILEHGPWCPGHGVPAHVSFDLTLDHVIPIEQGGAPFDERNTQVLCRGCNARKGPGGNPA